MCLSMENNVQSKQTNRSRLKVTSLLNEGPLICSDRWSVGAAEQRGSALMGQYYLLAGATGPERV